MLSYAIKGGLLTYSFLSNLNPFTMKRYTRASNSFAQLISPPLCCDVNFFVGSYFEFAMHMDAPVHFLRERFMVQHIGVLKAGSFFRHESLVFWVRDEENGNRFTFLLDRSPSARRSRATFASFGGCPDSKAVLESIQRAIDNMRSNNKLANLSATMTSESIPLTSTSYESPDAVPTPSTSYESSDTAPTPSTPSASYSSPTPSSYIPPLSLVDKITSSLAQAFAAASQPSQSSSESNEAEDKIHGIDKMDATKCIRRFPPKGLPFFDVVLLAKVVHEQAPIYSLFRNQCYWFANVIFEVIVQLYSRSASQPGPPPVPTLATGTPTDADALLLPADLPGEAGRCLGILISDPVVRQTIVTIVSRKFEEVLSSYISAVIFHCSSIPSYY